MSDPMTADPTLSESEREGWAEGRSTPRIDAFRDAAKQLRALLDEDA